MSGKKGAIHRPAIERWAEKIKPLDSGCWEWTSMRRPKGYGQFRVDGRTVEAHRWGYEFWIGPIPEGMHLDHWYCQNTWCVSPLHVEPVTPEENNRRNYERRTHCRNGHPYEGQVREYVEPSGYRHRICRECKKAWEAAKCL